MFKIMIVDDDPTSLAIGKAFLDNEYEMTLVRSGHQALGALKGEVLPDLILLDVWMPGINGLEVLRQLQQIDRLKDIPVIFLSGEKNVDLEVEGYAYGAYDFLQKPVNRELLKMKIRHVLAYRELRRENQELKERLNLI